MLAWERSMFALRRRGTVIAEGLKIVGSVTAEGLIEVNGQVEGELHCTSLIISRRAQIKGTIQAERVVVDGRVEGPIQGGDVILKSRAHVLGDIHHQLLTLERGAYFEGRSVRARENGQAPERVDKQSPRPIVNNTREADRAS
jgi:cytoskeletal protein CcmA (bactofilin family)